MDDTHTIGGAVKRQVLTQKQRRFIDTIEALETRKPLARSVVYWRDGHTWQRIADAFVPLEHVKHFKAEAPAGLYLAGVVGHTKVLVKGTQYSIAVFDERTNTLKPCPAGWSDDDTLLETAHRETDEELVIFALDRSVQYVPKGMGAALHVPSLGVTNIVAAVDIAPLTPLRLNIREEDKTLELVFTLDLTGIVFRDAQGKNLATIAYDDAWFQGGHFGSPPLLLDAHGVPRGGFFGQQGLCMFGELGLESMFRQHPDLLRT